MACAGWLACLTAGASAQVYRCGDTYQQTPCVGGRQVQVDDSRPPEQQRAAQLQAEADQARAASLRAERLEREQAFAKMVAAQNGSKSAPASKSKGPDEATPTGLNGGSDCAATGKKRQPKSRHANKRPPDTAESTGDDSPRLAASPCRTEVVMAAKPTSNSQQAQAKMPAPKKSVQAHQ